MTGLPFAAVIGLLQSGKKVRRIGWQSHYLFVTEITFNGFEPTLVYYIQGDDDEINKQPSALDWDDICSHDWELVE